LPHGSVSGSSAHAPHREHKSGGNVLTYILLSIHFYNPPTTMPLRIPLDLRSTNTCVKKKSKAPRVELSPYKYSIIEGLHKGGYSIKDIIEIEEIPQSIVRNTLKLFTIRPKEYSLPYFEYSFTLTKVQK
jgi:hypothetical protein